MWLVLRNLCEVVPTTFVKSAPDDSRAIVRAGNACFDVPWRDLFATEALAEKVAERERTLQALADDDP